MGPTNFFAVISKEEYQTAVFRTQKATRWRTGPPVLGTKPLSSLPPSENSHIRDVWGKVPPTNKEPRPHPPTPKLPDSLAKRSFRKGLPLTDTIKYVKKSATTANSAKLIVDPEDELTSLKERLRLVTEERDSLKAAMQTILGEAKKNRVNL